jgi:hypothetical protein
MPAKILTFISLETVLYFRGPDSCPGTFSDQPHHTLVSLVSNENGASLDRNYFNVEPPRKLAIELCKVINKWTYISNEKRPKILADNRTTSS